MGIEADNPGYGYTGTSLSKSTVFPESKPHGSGNFCQSSERVV